jgi:outer membrane protein TolC
MHKTSWLVGALAAALTSTPIAASAASVLSAPPLAGPAAAPATAPSWWIGFQEPALDQLQAVALASAGRWSAAQQAELATAYVTLRVQNLRLHNAAELRESTRHERALRGAASPTRETAQQLAALDERAGTADRAITAFTQQRDAALRRLLQLTPADPAAAKAALAEALDNRELPNFAREVPQRLPASVLLSRADVAEAERNLAAHSSMSLLLSGWIAPASQPAPLALPGQDEGVDDTLQQAGREVSWSLRQLIDSSRKAAADAQRLEARRLDLLATERRVKAGDADPSDLLSAHQRYLAEADAMAQAQGQLALAWIALHAQAPGSISALAARVR